MHFKVQTLAQVCDAKTADAIKYVRFLNPASTAAGLNTLERVAMFLTQITYESNHLAFVEENLNYSAERLVQVWPSRFPTIEAAEPYAHNPAKLANRVYNGRMGNVEGSGDGWNFRGRGLIQLTGRDNYSKMNNYLGVGLLNNPDLASTPKIATAIAIKFWSVISGNAFADINDIHGCTRALNGGLTGIDERIELWHSVTAELVKLGPLVYGM